MNKIVVFITVFLSFNSFSQRDLKTEAIFTPIFGLNYKANFSGGDLNKRWGFTNSIGADIDFKLKSNLIFGIDGCFMFGSTFKDSSIFDNVINSYGTITPQSGASSSDIVFFLMRGMNVNANIGYVFNKLGHNPNSGLWVNFGAGFMAHKIRIESLFDDVVPLEGDYRKGYDKLSMGITTKQFVGYLFQHDERFLNFYVGLEFVQGYTKNVRNYNFDTKGPEPELRIDLMNSIKVGWMIPIYKRQGQDYYY
jgi:hypothetical protein